MSGPNNIDRKTLGDRLARRVVWAELFGWMVGSGLVIEYWREIVDCFVKWQLPPLPLVGGLLVTLGVFGEVWFSRLAQKTTEQISERADSDVALANERAAQAEREIAGLNAETELLRRENNDTALLLSDRSIGDPSKFAEQMSRFRGTRFIFEILADDEPRKLASRIRDVLKKSGWIELAEPARRMVPMLIGVGVTTVEERGEAGEALADWLNAQRVACLTHSKKLLSGLAPGTVIVEVGPKPETLHAQRLLESDRVRQKSRL